MKFSIWVRKKFRDHGAEILTFFPVPYIAVSWLLSAAAKATQQYLGWDGLFWQCLAALSMTFFVLGPLCIIISSGIGISHAVNKLRAGKPAGRYIALIVIDLAVIVLSAAWFWLQWYA